jgi:hypothetical protein
MPHTSASGFRRQEGNSCREYANCSFECRCQQPDSRGGRVCDAWLERGRGSRGCSEQRETFCTMIRAGLRGARLGAILP